MKNQGALLSPTGTTTTLRGVSEGIAYRETGVPDPFFAYKDVMDQPQHSKAATAYRQTALHLPSLPRNHNLGGGAPPHTPYIETSSLTTLAYKQRNPHIPSLPRPPPPAPAPLLALPVNKPSAPPVPLAAAGSGEGAVAYRPLGMKLAQSNGKGFICRCKDVPCNFSYATCARCLAAQVQQLQCEIAAIMLELDTFVVKGGDAILDNVIANTITANEGTFGSLAAGSSVTVRELTEEEKEILQAVKDLYGNTTVEVAM